MSCSSCKSSSCSGCNSCCTTPFYAQPCAEVQDHCQKVYQAQYAYSVCPESDWNIPLCGGTAVLSIPGIIGIAVGVNLWHPNYGYFEVTSVDLVRGTITVTNNCPNVDYQAAPGTQIPKCTCFSTVPLPYDAEGPNTQVCVAVSFTAPALDVETDITVTSTSSLEVGDTLQIGSGFYYLAEIKPNNVITIVNRGEGIVPGTAVVAQDVNGNYLNCISVIQSSPCSRPEVDEGNIVGCDEDGLLGPLNPDTFTGGVQSLVSEEEDIALVDTAETTPITMTIVNPSPTRSMHVMLSYVATTTFELGAMGTMSQLDIHANVNGGGYLSVMVGPLTYVILGDTSTLQHGFQATEVSVFVVAPGGTLTVQVKALYDVMLASGQALVGDMTLELKAIAIAI